MNHGESKAASSASNATNRTRNQGATASYARTNWNGSLGYQNTTLSNSVASSADSSSDTWTANLGWIFSEGNDFANATWSIFANVLGSFQRQELATGASGHTDTYSLSLTGQHKKWGTLSGTIGTSRGNAAGGGGIETNWYQLDGSHRLGEKGGIKLYVRRIESAYGTTANQYRERTAGVQLSYLF